MSQLINARVGTGQKKPFVPRKLPLQGKPVPQAQCMHSETSLHRAHHTKPHQTTHKKSGTK